MKASLLQLFNRLEVLSTRERVMTLAGIPLALLAAGEMLVFNPARSQATEAQKQAKRSEGEVKALGAALAALPAVAPLPAAGQLLRQRNELQGRIAAAEETMASLKEGVDWGTVVRATVAGTPGLTLTQFKT